MIIDDQSVFFFSNGDRYGLHENNMSDIISDDFSIYCRFKPDFIEVDRQIKEFGVYNGALFAKNGKHFGLFFNGYTDGNGHIHKEVSWTFWSHDAEKGIDVVRSIDFKFFTGRKTTLQRHDSEERYFNIVINHDVEKKEFTMTEEISKKTETLKYDNIIDYSDSYTWLGAATLISDSHQSVFRGDIDKIHIQRSKVDDVQSSSEFFSNYESFLEKKNVDNNTSKNVFSSDFKKRTYYKLMDMSDNGFHPVLFKKEWIGNA